MNAQEVKSRKAKEKQKRGLLFLRKQKQPCQQLKLKNVRHAKPKEKCDASSAGKNAKTDICIIQKPSTISFYISR
jgi:hypothetical protein